jgi:hypothetical protein
VNDAKELDDMYCSVRAIVMARERVHGKAVAAADADAEL